MAARRETRSRSAEKLLGGTDVIEEEMEAWRQVASMIGESLENVANMGHQERTQLMLLLPKQQQDHTLHENQEDSGTIQLLGSDKEDDHRSDRAPKRARPHQLLCDEAMGEHKKLKLSHNNANCDGSTISTDFNQIDVAYPSSIHSTPDLSSYMATPSSSETHNHSHLKLASPLFKKQVKQRITSVSPEPTNKEHHIESQDSGETEESQNLLSNDMITSIPQTPDNSPDCESKTVNVALDEDTENVALDDEQKNTLAIKKLFNADTLEVEMSSTSANYTLNNNLEILEHNKLIKNAVINKITEWKDDYMFGEITYLCKSVRSPQECFTLMQQNPTKYKFNKFSPQVNASLEASNLLKNVQNFSLAVKHIKSQYCGGEIPTGKTALSDKWDGDCAMFVRGDKTSCSKLSNAGLRTRRTRGKVTANNKKDDQNSQQEANSPVDDSEDDFEDTKATVDSHWNPELEKTHLSGDKSGNTSGGKTRKPSGGSTKLFSKDFPTIKEEISSNQKQWLGKETKGKARSGEGGFGRPKLSVEKNDANFAFEPPSVSKFIDRGMQKSKIVLQEARQKKEREDKINNPLTAMSVNRAVVSPVEEKGNDDEVEVIAEVAASPSPRDPTTTGRRRNSSADKNLTRSMNAESLEKLSLLGNVTVTRNQKLDTEGGDTLPQHSQPQDLKGECPMCQREFLMTELEPHAAECQGRANHQLRKRL